MGKTRRRSPWAEGEGRRGSFRTSRWSEIALLSRDKDDGLSRWVQSLCARRNKNVAAVALANKTMRRAWALLTRGTDYRPDQARALESATAGA